MELSAKIALLYRRWNGFEHMKKSLRRSNSLKRRYEMQGIEPTEILGIAIQTTVISMRMKRMTTEMKKISIRAKMRKKRKKTHKH